MSIEVASSDDAAAIARIHRSARQKAMPWLPVLHTPDDDLWYFKTLVLPVQKVLIAHEGVHPVGFISVDKGWLNHLYISPDSWGFGFGTRLLEAARFDLSYLQLWVFQMNVRARDFYLKSGFNERELTDGQHNEEKVPDIRMEWVRDN